MLIILVLNSNDSKCDTLFCKICFCSRKRTCADALWTRSFYFLLHIRRVTILQLVSNKRKEDEICITRRVYNLWELGVVEREKAGRNYITPGTRGGETIFLGWPSLKAFCRVHKARDPFFSLTLFFIPFKDVCRTCVDVEDTQETGDWCN